MKIYNKEHTAGLTDQLNNNNCSLACAVYAVQPTEQEIMKVLASANPNQQDLFYIESILASVGWNDNDDVFDASEIWTAKSTPIDKQFNFMHNEKDIIGHITSSKIIANNQIIEKQEDLPEKFDIVVGSVLYKRWEDQELQQRMDKLIAEITENKWFVSMECLFSNFDYAIIDPEGNFKSVARNEETSFLTKHLRVYGGTGEYEGFKLGRLLRNFTFSGKGLVDNPANKRSVIFNFSNISDQETSFHVVANKEFIMPFTEEQYRDLEQRLAQAEKAAKDAADKAVASQIQDLEAKISELTQSNSNLSTEKEDLVKKLALAEDISAAKTDSSEKLEAKVQELEKVLAEKQEAIDAVEAEKVRAERIALFADKEIDQAKAVNLVEKCSDMTQESFAALVDSFPAKSEDMGKDKEDKDKDKEDKKAKDKSKASDDEILAELNIIDGAPLSTDANELNDIRTEAADWFGQTFNLKGEK